MKEPWYPPACRTLPENWVTCVSPHLSKFHLARAHDEKIRRPRRRPHPPCHLPVGKRRFKREVDILNVVLSVALGVELGVVVTAVLVVSFSADLGVVLCVVFCVALSVVRKVFLIAVLVVVPDVNISVVLWAYATRCERATRQPSGKPGAFTVIFYDCGTGRQTFRVKHRQRHQRPPTICFTTIEATVHLRSKRLARTRALAADRTQPPTTSGSCYFLLVATRDPLLTPLLSTAPLRHDGNTCMS